MIKLIKNGTLFGPEPLGKKDILIADGRIAKIADCIELTASDFIEIIDASEKLVIPGLIDNHVHLLGGGGEGGYKTRTPELIYSDLVKGGITTVVGCIGTDGITRQMTSLIAKARGLTEEGITAFIYTGSYRIPVAGLTESIQKDIMMIPEIIGVGEVAISDHRSSSPTHDELARVASDARVGGILSGKAGIVNFHLGDGKEGLQPLIQLVERTELPKTQFLPTHANRNGTLFQQAIAYAKEGGFIDFTTSTVPKFIEEGEVPAGQAYVECINTGVDASQITFSSDGQGSLPNFDKEGKLIGLDVGRVTSLFDAFKNLVMEHGLTINKALMPITKNPAGLLKLKGKGIINEGFDADLLILDQHQFEIHSVLAMGQWLMKDKQIVKKGTFEI